MNTECLKACHSHQPRTIKLFIDVNCPRQEERELINTFLKKKSHKTHLTPLTIFFVVIVKLTVNFQYQTKNQKSRSFQINFCYTWVISYHTLNCHIPIPFKADSFEMQTTSPFSSSVKSQKSQRLVSIELLENGTSTRKEKVYQSTSQAGKKLGHHFMQLIHQIAL